MRFADSRGNLYSENGERLGKWPRRDLRSIVLLLGAVAFALLPLLLLAGCASVPAGSDAVVVKAEDVLTNSLTLYDGTMELHFKHSTSEPPAVYKALEQVRPAFPRAWRGLSTTLASYKAAKTKEPATIRKAVLDFLDEIEKDGPPSWKTAVQGIRSVFNREAP